MAEGKMRPCPRCGEPCADWRTACPACGVALRESREIPVIEEDRGELQQLIGDLEAGRPIQRSASPPTRVVTVYPRACSADSRRSRLRQSSGSRPWLAPLVCGSGGTRARWARLVPAPGDRGVRSAVPDVRRLLLRRHRPSLMGRWACPGVQPVPLRRFEQLLHHPRLLALLLGLRVMLRAPAERYGDEQCSDRRSHGDYPFTVTLVGDTGRTLAVAFATAASKCAEPAGVSACAAR